MSEHSAEYTAAIDQRLNEAIKVSNYRLTLLNQKQNAKLKLQKDLIYAEAGGIFEITPELISFIQTLITLGKKSAILLDVNKNPIELKDINVFLENILDIYYENMNEFLQEFKSLQKSRTVESIIGK